MSASNFRLCLYLCLVACLTVVSAAPIPILNIEELTKRADVVAVGTVTAISELGRISQSATTGQVAGRRMAAQLLIDQVVKGPQLTSLQFQFALADVPGAALGVVDAGSYRMFFLKRQSDRFELADPYYPSLVASQGHQSTSATAYEKVLEEVAFVVGAGQALAHQKREAIDTLWGIRHPVSTSALRAALKDGDSNIRLSAAAALLKINDSSALPTAETALTQGDPNASPETLQNLRVAIAQGGRDPQAVESLARLVSKGDVETRRAASSALRSMRSPAAANVLANALSDNDEIVRYMAVSALAEVNREPEWGPSLPEFQADQQKYLNHWVERTRKR